VAASRRKPGLAIHLPQEQHAGVAGRLAGVEGALNVSPLYGWKPEEFKMSICRRVIADCLIRFTPSLLGFKRYGASFHSM
jgi:hypothetical protein